MCSFASQSEDEILPQSLCERTQFHGNFVDSYRILKKPKFYFWQLFCCRHLVEVKLHGSQSKANIEGFKNSIWMCFPCETKWDLNPSSPVSTSCSVQPVELIGLKGFCLCEGVHAGKES